MEPAPPSSLVIHPARKCVKHTICKKKCVFIFIPLAAVSLCDCVFTVPFVLCTVVMLVVYAVQGLKFVGFICVLYSLQIVPINDWIFTFQLEKANAVFLSLLIWFEMWLLQYSNIQTFDTKKYTVYNITHMIIYCEYPANMFGLVRLLFICIHLAAFSVLIKSNCTLLFSQLCWQNLSWRPYTLYVFWRLLFAKTRSIEYKTCAKRYTKNTTYPS